MNSNHNRTLLILVLSSVLTFEATAEPDWSRPSLGEHIFLRLNHGQTFDPDDRGKDPKYFRKRPPENRVHLNELLYNIEAAILKVDGFAKESPFTPEELLVLATSFDKAQWDDFFDPGHMGVGVTGSLVFPAKHDEKRAWVVEFWHKGGVRLVPATWCAPGIYQMDALGKSSTLDGASGKILRDHGVEMVRSRQKAEDAFAP